MQLATAPLIERHGLVKGLFQDLWGEIFPVRMMHDKKAVASRFEVQVNNWYRPVISNKAIASPLERLGKKKSRLSDVHLNSRTISHSLYLTRMNWSSSLSFLSSIPRKRTSLSPESSVQFRRTR
ncbi:MAG: hypothetical protein Q9169_005352 [Polycauliona sp. 2 TL-2023]